MLGAKLQKHRDASFRRISLIYTFLFLFIIFCCYLYFFYQLSSLIHLVFPRPCSDCCYVCFSAFFRPLSSLLILLSATSHVQYPITEAVDLCRHKWMGEALRKWMAISEGALSVWSSSCSILPAAAAVQGHQGSLCSACRSSMLPQLVLFCNINKEGG